MHVAHVKAASSAAKLALVAAAVAAKAFGHKDRSVDAEGGYRKATFISTIRLWYRFRKREIILFPTFNITHFSTKK